MEQECVMKEGVKYIKGEMKKATHFDDFREGDTYLLMCPHCENKTYMPIDIANFSYGNYEGNPVLCPNCDKDMNLSMEIVVFTKA
jgi:ssDNA-binding Zn-finger/Zn-ribbon topoisomerase 1